MIGNSVTYEMGVIAKINIHSYMGDLIIDGMCIAENPDQCTWLWLVRETGTDLIPLEDKYPPDYPFCDFVKRADKIYFLEFFRDIRKKRISTGEVMEINAEQATMILESCIQ